GRMNKFFKRRFRSLRKKLGRVKKLSAIKKIHNKEQRWMTDQDHKISREIVNFAIENNVQMSSLTSSIMCI
ncbi:MAG: transposase, partial [Bacillota bacterium]|nr:transposase [Bacillota bacterium]